jgi:hypothetical protein
MFAFNRRMQMGPGPAARSLDTGHKSLDAGHKSLDAGHKSLDAGHKSLDAGHKSLDAGHKSLDAGQPPDPLQIGRRLPFLQLKAELLKLKIVYKK